MSDKIKIEALNESHLIEVAELYTQLAVYLKENTKDDYFDFTSLSAAEIAEDLRSNLANNEFITYVASAGETVIGFISGSITNYFLPIATIKKVGYISGAYMNPIYRNRGIIKEMERRIIEFFKKKNVKYIELNTIANHVAGKNSWNRPVYNTFSEQFKNQI